MKKRESMKWSTILSVLEQAVPYVKTVCPFLFQEPLMEKRLIAILDNIKQLNPKCDTAIFTNMSLMTPELSRELIETGYLDKLHISFYGPNQHVYELLQPQLGYSEVRCNIQRFMKIRDSLKKKKPYVTMHYITMPMLIPYHEGFFKEWRQIVDKVGYVAYDTFHGCMPYVDQRSYWGEPEPSMIPCQRLWTQFNILSNGDVVPCCLDYDGELVLGNVNESSVGGIWTGKLFKELRQKHMQYQFPSMCRDCMVYEYQFTLEWNQYWRQQQKRIMKPLKLSH